MLRKPPVRNVEAYQANVSRSDAESQWIALYLLYAIALLTTAVATFGGAGLVLAIVIGVSWACVFAAKSRPRALGRVIFTLVVLYILSLFIPAVQARSPSRRWQCANNLKQIALALQSYHDTYKTFPPAFIPDKKGKPKHSWRVLILPFLEQQALHVAYDFDEPWDGPNNRQLVEAMPRVYLCPSDRPYDQHDTSYFAVVGSKTMWPGDQGVQYRDVLDGSSNTLLLMEARSQQVNWMEPRDLDYDEAMRLLTEDLSPEEWLHPSRGFFYENAGARNVAFADTRIEYFPPGLLNEAASALLLRADGAPTNSLETGPIVSRRLRLDSCIRLWIFVVVAAFPLPWVWNRTRPARRHRV